MVKACVNRGCKNWIEAGTKCFFCCDLTEVVCQTCFPNYKCSQCSELLSKYFVANYCSDCHSVKDLYKCGCKSNSIKCQYCNAGECEECKKPFVKF